MKSNFKQENGFSIFELIVVLALIIIITAIAVPIFGSNNTYSRIRSSAYNIAGQLNQAKSRAVTELSPYRMEFDPAPATGWRLIKRDRVTGAESVVNSGSLSLGVEYALPPPEANSAGSEQQCGGISGVCMPQQSALIAFNTRGIPIDIVSRVPIAQNAIYLTDGKVNFAVTVSLAGTVEVWRYFPQDKIWVRP